MSDMAFLDEKEQQLLDKIVSSKECYSDGRKIPFNIGKVVINSTLFILAYFFRNSIYLIFFLAFFLLQYLTLSFAYAKVTSIDSRIILKFYEKFREDKGSG